MAIPLKNLAIDCAVFDPTPLMNKRNMRHQTPMHPATLIKIDHPLDKVMRTISNPNKLFLKLGNKSWF